MNSFNKSNVKSKFDFFIFATLCSFPQHLNKHEKLSITLLFPYTFSNDFWGLWTNVIEHGRKIFNSAKVASRDLCAPGSEHSSSKIRRTRYDDEMPQVPRILQTDIVYGTHLHHEKAERLAAIATCMQDSCKSANGWESLGCCRVGMAVPPPRKYWN